MTAYDVYHLNLSAAPFRNRRLFWLGLAVAFGLLTISTALLMQYYAQLLSNEHRYVEFQKASQTALEGEQARLAKLRGQITTAGLQPTPEQVRAMREALYLLERRQLSWSRFLLQIEQQLPADIRIVQIAFGQEEPNPAVTSQATGKAPQGNDLDTPLPVAQDVPFTLTVRAPKPEAVTAFIRACDERGIFYFDPNTQATPSDHQASSSKQEVEFTLRGRYRLGDAQLAAGLSPREVRQ
jgi:hypothetical protein